MENTISKKNLNNKKSLNSIYFHCKVHNAGVILLDEENANEILKKKICQTLNCIQFQNVLNLLNRHHHLLFIEHPQCASTLQVKLKP